MRALLIACLAITMTVAGCSSSDETSNTTSPTTTAPTTMMNHTMMTHNVAIAGNAFVNATITIHVGDKVVWTHGDGTTAHTVTADDGSFDSRPNCAAGVPVSQVCMVDGDTFEFTFPKAGTVSYHCKVHPSMTGKVVVEEMMM